MTTRTVPRVKNGKTTQRRVFGVVFWVALLFGGGHALAAYGASHNPTTPNSGPMVPYSQYNAPTPKCDLQICD